MGRVVQEGIREAGRSITGGGKSNRVVVRGVWRKGNVWQQLRRGGDILGMTRRLRAESRGVASISWSRQWRLN